MAPAYAASGKTPVLSIGGACKAPGNSCNPFVKGYVVNLTITNPSNKTIWLYVPPSISAVGTSLAFGYAGYDDGGVLNTGNIEVPAGASVTVRLSTTAQNSANAVFTMTLTFEWGHTPAAAGDTEHDPVSVSTTVPGTPPDCCKDAAVATTSAPAARSSAETSSSTSTAAAPTSSSTSAPATQAPPASLEPTPATTAAP
ncbi:hypothetical protein LP422_15630 [Janibacter limosus]|uniref:Uncharacterized protein n=1 Tax=Janibacter limosus TaxID=53458 RepID=A0AC61U209_9MICO|nr:hypothetical protein [Janibacter limosus]UUZ44049.1 hypothetical protein LP422_15630 [Janibacter limosus]